jgi:hypothetical protein
MGLGLPTFSNMKESVLRHGIKSTRFAGLESNLKVIRLMWQKTQESKAN